MKNTSIVYRSAERTPAVLAELVELLFPLSGEQLTVLEADLLRNSCYSPVIVNEELVIVGGHNCQGLCGKRGTPYNMVVSIFDDLLETKQWTLGTQKGRRSLDRRELGGIVLKLKPGIETRVRANMSAGGGDQKSEHTRSGSAILSNPISTMNTRKELAGTMGLGECTMGKVMQIDEYAPAAVREALDKRELSTHQGYQIARQVENLPEGQREQAALEAMEPTKVKKEIQEKDVEINREGKIARIFCKAYEKVVLLDPTEEDIRI